MYAPTNKSLGGIYHIRLKGSWDSMKVSYLILCALNLVELFWDFVLQIIPIVFELMT
jgi:hypothetical protein